MQSMQNVQVLSQMAADRQAQLRAATHWPHTTRSSRHVRRWLGLQLVRLGAWLAAEPTMRPLTAR